MTLHNITLKETVTKNMVIEAETLEDAEVIALNHLNIWYGLTPSVLKPVSVVPRKKNSTIF